MNVVKTCMPPKHGCCHVLRELMLPKRGSCDSMETYVVTTLLLLQHGVCHNMYVVIAWMLPNLGCCHSMNVFTQIYVLKSAEFLIEGMLLKPFMKPGAHELLFTWTGSLLFGLDFTYFKTTQTLLLFRYSVTTENCYMYGMASVR